MIPVFNTHPFSYCCLGIHRWVQLVNWIEKASLENIRRLLEIIEAEYSHELILTVRNL